MNLDETTGLPQVPEGYFWRVRDAALHISVVELRKRFRWFGSYAVEKRTSAYYDNHGNVLDPAEEILRCAESIMREFNDPWIPFYGDYPPKSLKNS